MAGLVRWWAGCLYTLLFGHEDRFILFVCFLVSLQNPHLINLNLSMVNCLIVFMVGHWVCLDVCWLEGMFWPCLVWGRMRCLLAVAVGAQSSDSQVPLRVLLVKAQLWQVLLEHGSDKITPQHAAAGGPTQASKIVSELGERFNYRLWELLVLLLSRFRRVQLCATHETAAHQAPPPWDSPGKNTGVGCHFLLQCMKVKTESEVAQSCPALSDPIDCSYQALPSMGFSRQEYWSGVPLPSPLWELGPFFFLQSLLLLIILSSPTCPPFQQLPIKLLLSFVMMYCICNIDYWNQFNMSSLYWLHIGRNP